MGYYFVSGFGYNQSMESGDTMDLVFFMIVFQWPLPAYFP